MIDRLRTMSPAFRYSVYFAGVLLVLFVAIGVGATAAVVVGWQSERFATGTADTGAASTSAPEASETETTGIARASEGTAIEPSGDPSDDTTPVASFVHRATDENSRGDYTYIGEASIDGNNDAVVLASPTSGDGDGGVSYDHNIGVWYEGGARKWAIFNQDRSVVPAGAAFEVVVPPASTTFVHRAELLNTVGNYTYLDDPLTNDRPDADVEITQNWNPGGGGGIYNDHPVGVVYDEDVQQWAIFNRDGVPIPEGAAFNVAVSASANESAR